MRQLTKKQKQLLDQWYEQNKNNLVIGFDIQYNDNFSYELIQKLEEINDTEILVQEVNRYINDKIAGDF